jgi:hypothetical protein
MKNDLSADVDYLAARLTPLFTEGKPVALQLFAHHQFSAYKNPLVIFTPGLSLGWPRELIAVAVVNHGSAIIELETTRAYNRNRKKNIPYKPKIADCVRAGIPAKLATALVTTLQLIAIVVVKPSKEKPYGNITPQCPSRRIRRPGTPRKCTPFRPC